MLSFNKMIQENTLMVIYRNYSFTIQLQENSHSIMDTKVWVTFYSTIKSFFNRVFFVAIYFLHFHMSMSYLGSKKSQWITFLYCQQTMNFFMLKHWNRLRKNIKKWRKLWINENLFCYFNQMIDYYILVLFLSQNVTFICLHI